MYERILLPFFGDLGDTLLTVPAMRAVRRGFPGARVVLLTKSLPAEVVTKLALVDEIIVVDKHLFDRPQSLLSPRGWLALARLLLRLRRERFDTVLLFHHLVTRWGALKFALLALGSGAAVRAGIDNGRGWFLTHSVKDQGFGARHEAEYFLDVARLVGCEGPLELEAPLNEKDRDAAAEVLRRHGLAERRLLVVHPGVGWYGPGRRWPAPRFARAAELIANETELHCVVVGTPEELDLASEVAHPLGCRATNLAGQTTLGELAGIVERAELVLANDSGVAHVAAAVGTPPVTVFGPSNDRAWRPLLGTVIAEDLACRPCFYRDFERGLPAGSPRRECLELITPQTVASAALALLSERVAI